MISTITDNETKPTPIVAIGAGNRMRTYMQYVAQNPDKVRLVALAEPDDVRRDSLGDIMCLPQELRFANYNDLFKAGVKAQAAIVATPESEHFRPTTLALRAGCHVLLEKPIAQTYEQCLDIASEAKRCSRKVAICHVLRYHPMFLKIKELVDSGAYGRIISVSHTEEVGIDRGTHSYVRGTMNRERENNPLLLAKCCHDVDFLLWLTGKRCRRVSSMGSLAWFRNENAPAGSSYRCMDCGMEQSCPYSAVDLYKRRRDWISNFIPGPGESVDDVIDRELNHGKFGRCVYHCDNDVADNQVVTMQMEDDTLITLSINFFTQRDCRSMEIGLTKGQILCDGECVHARDFRSGHTDIYDFSRIANAPYHGGADFALMEDFLRLIRGEKNDIATEIDDALEAHRVIFEAERGRKEGITVNLSRENGEVEDTEK